VTDPPPACVAVPAPPDVLADPELPVDPLMGPVDDDAGLCEPAADPAEGVVVAGEIMV